MNDIIKNYLYLNCYNKKDFELNLHIASEYNSPREYLKKSDSISHKELVLADSNKPRFIKRLESCINNSSIVDSEISSLSDIWAYCLIFSCIEKSPNKKFEYLSIRLNKVREFLHPNSNNISVREMQLKYNFVLNSTKNTALKAIEFLSLGEIHIVSITLSRITLMIPSLTLPPDLRGLKQVLMKNSFNQFPISIMCSADNTIEESSNILKNHINKIMHCNKSFISKIHDKTSFHGRQSIHNDKENHKGFELVKGSNNYHNQLIFEIPKEYDICRLRIDVKGFLMSMGKYSNGYMNLMQEFRLKNYHFFQEIIPRIVNKVNEAAKNKLLILLSVADDSVIIGPRVELTTAWQQILKSYVLTFPMGEIVGSMSGIENNDTAADLALKTTIVNMAKNDE